MTDENGNLYFIDFGLGELITDHKNQYVWGTPNYNSIEKSLNNMLFWFEEFTFKNVDYKVSDRPE